MDNNNKNDSKSTNNKRSNKPLMEKRRRERINVALTTIKEIVLIAQQKDLSKFKKLEKADILEMTLQHIRVLHGSSSLTSTNKNHERFVEGFEKCISEVESFARSQMHLSSPPVMTHLLAHLKSSSARHAADDSSAPLLAPSKKRRSVTAPVDRSIFKAGVIRHEAAASTSPAPAEVRVPPTKSSTPFLPSEQRVPQAPPADMEEHPFKHELMTPAWGNAPSPHAFPPSPPDSSRCSSSPDSLGCSPRYDVYEQYYLHLTGIEKALGVNSQLHEDSHNSLPVENLNANKPLNLSIQKPTEPLCPHNSEVPALYIKQELSSPAPPNVTQEPQAGPSRAHAARDARRPAPYPKKEAVKRYQAEAEDAAGVARFDGDPQAVAALDSLESHWRPW